MHRCATFLANSPLPGCRAANLTKFLDIRSSQKTLVSLSCDVLEMRPTQIMSSMKPQSRLHTTWSGVGSGRNFEKMACDVSNNCWLIDSGVPCDVDFVCEFLGMRKGWRWSNSFTVHPTDLEYISPIFGSPEHRVSLMLSNRRSRTAEFVPESCFPRTPSAR